MAINGFVFPSGMMTPTLLDVAAILGFPNIKEEIPSLFDQILESLDFKVTKSITSYPIFITYHNQVKGLIADVEHKAFLLFWFCKFFICTNSLGIINEFAYYVAIVIRVHMST